MDDINTTRSTPQLIGDLIHHIGELIRKEFELLRSEMGDKSRQVATAVGMIVAAVVISLTALNVLAAALVAALENLGLSIGWASVAVGVGLAVIAMIMAAKGISDLKASNLTPERTMHSVSEDARLARDQTAR